MTILKRIKVLNKEEYLKRILLFTALGKVYNILFSPDIDINDSDGIVCFSNKLFPENYHKPVIFYSLNTGTPVNKKIEFKNADFFGVDFSNKSFNTSSYEVKESLRSNNVIARQENNVIWSVDEYDGYSHYFSAIPPKELPEKYSLKYLFYYKDFISLFPLLVFIRRLINENIIFPEKMASFITDDPNFHSSGYGYIDYQLLVDEAVKYNYHSAIATIPLDSFWASKKTVKLFLDNKKYISAIVHGNNHTFSEFLINKPEDAAFSVEQIIQRISKFKAMYDLEIQNVLTAPHGMMSSQMLNAVSDSNFSGVVISRPFPWHEHNATVEDIKETEYFSNWFPADFTEGTPVINRMKEVIDVPFKLFLNIPLIFYFHHWEFKNGYDFLRDIVKEVSGYSDVKWLSMEEIFNRNYFLSHSDDDTIDVILFSKNIKLNIPGKFNKIKCHVVNNVGDDNSFSFNVSNCNCNSKLSQLGFTQYSRSEILPEADKEITISLTGIKNGNNQIHKNEKYAFYPYFRRVLTETRDRVEPLSFNSQHKEFTKCIQYQGYAICQQCSQYAECTIIEK